ncbi:MAG: hypothetical protein Q9168_005277, partial [Polycauliona sp. 1 TL-2023]
MRSSIAVRHVQGSNGHLRLIPITRRQHFHDYFVTHLPSSSLHPDSRTSGGPHHQLPRSASKPHDPRSAGGPSPAPILGHARDTTVVRIPLRSAKHHFGASVSRGQRPYNEDTYQAGVIELPAFAKRAPINLTRAPASSPLQAYREGQRRKQEQDASTGTDGEGTSAGGANGDPQVFYFGVFDGHGGTECSGFLKEKLHEYVEEAAQKYGIESSLRGKTDGSGHPQKQKKPETSLSPAQKAVDASAAKDNDSGSRQPGSQASGDGNTAIPTADFERPSSSAKAAASPLGSVPPEETTTLQKKLILSWKETVGGYFRRFSPAAFNLDPPTPSTILTHAFLTADLSFITAQLKLSASDADPVLADSPINTSDIVPYGPYTPANPSSTNSKPSHTTTPSKPRTPFKGGSTAS